MFTVTVLGSGTSSGVPSIGCKCETCLSTDPRDKRLRTSVWIKSEKGSFVIDTSSDFRQQVLREGIERLDAVIYTHHHFDHIAGFDDLRGFNFIQHEAIPIYLTRETYTHMGKVFDYAFTENPMRESSAPSAKVCIIEKEPFAIGDMKITPLPLYHGRLPVNGYRIGSFAYCTDCNRIPDEALDRLVGVEVLILDALRFREHPTHFTLEQASRVAEKIGARETYFTHIAHDMKHAETNSQLPTGMKLAYDGLRLQVP